MLIDKNIFILVFHTIIKDLLAFFMLIDKNNIIKNKNIFIFILAFGTIIKYSFLASSCHKIKNNIIKYLFLI